ncbi:helix-turn-helix domain-containing protein [Streptomyces sp. MS2A]|nr:helix-turn-helix domain-containing protein [Streptomyces sp. MS2A]
MPERDRALTVTDVIRYFDALSEAGADSDECIRAAARLTGCPVSVRGEDGAIRRCDPDGGFGGGTVHPRGEDILIERRGDAPPTDTVVRSRLRHCLRIAARVHGQVRRGEAGLVEVLLDAREGREARMRAAQLLGLDLRRPVRVLAVTAVDDTITDVLGRCSPGGLWRSGAVGEVTALVIQDDGASGRLSRELNDALARAYPAQRPDEPARPPWVGIGEAGPASSAAESWRQARHALSFTTSMVYGWRAIAFGSLGAVAALAEIPIGRLDEIPVIARLNELAATRSGRIDVYTLEAFCVFGSLRRTAEDLHLHHSTVASRVERVSRAMGWDMTSAVDRFMATLALMMRRMTLTQADLRQRGGL